MEFSEVVGTGKQTIEALKQAVKAGGGGGGGNLEPRVKKNEDDISALKIEDVSLDDRITALEDAGGGGGIVESPYKEGTAEFSHDNYNSRLKLQIPENFHNLFISELKFNTPVSGESFCKLGNSPGGKYSIINLYDKQNTSKQFYTGFIKIPEGTSFLTIKAHVGKSDTYFIINCMGIDSHMIDSFQQFLYNSSLDVSVLNSVETMQKDIFIEFTGGTQYISSSKKILYN